MEFESWKEWDNIENSNKTNDLSSYPYPLHHQDIVQWDEMLVKPNIETHM